MSSKIRQRLGELQLISANRSLQLDLEACIEASSSRKDASEHECLLMHHLPLVISPETWVCRGNGLRLVIDLGLSDYILSTEETERLSRAIREAEAGIVHVLLDDC